jgi:HK97 family phage portal protein
MASRPKFLDRALSLVGLARRDTGASSTLTDPAGWLLNAMGGLPTMSGARINEISALGVPAAYACINLLGNLVGSLPARVVKRTAAGHEDLDSHPVSILLLRAPNEQHTPFEFRRLVQARVGGSGIGYARVYRDAYYQPTALVPVRTSDVQILSPGPGQVRYRVRMTNSVTGAANTGTEILTRADLVQVNALSTDGFGGISPITMLRENMGIAMAQRDALGSFLKNGSRFPGILTASGLTEAQMKDFRVQWDAMQAGVTNSGKMPILNGAFSYLDKSAGMSMADAEFLASRSFENNEICSVFGIPPVLIGNNEKTSSWGTGIEQINQGFLTYGLNPWLVNWEQALGFSLLTAQEQADGLSILFDRSALLQASLAARSAFYQQMRMIGVMSINDVRHEIGFNDLPPDESDGIGDDYTAPFNNQGGVNKGTPAAEPAEPTPTAKD